MFDHVDKHPRDAARRRGGVGVERGEHGADGPVQGGAAVEAEPAEVDQRRAQEGEGDVVTACTARGFLARALALAEDEGVRQCGPARGDVHGTAAGEVETGQVVEPAVRIPGPVRDRAVHDGGPPETENQRWDDAAAFKCASDHDHDRLQNADG